MTATTIREALTRANVQVPDELIADLAVPVIVDRPQRQGDVGIFPLSMLRGPLSGAEVAALEPVPAKGVRVVESEATGNTHLLMTEVGCPPVLFARRSSDLTLGVVRVPEGSVAHLIHTDEHGVNAFGPGDWLLHGKREQAEEIRRVAD